MNRYILITEEQTIDIFQAPNDRAAMRKVAEEYNETMVLYRVEGCHVVLVEEWP